MLREKINQCVFTDCLSQAHDREASKVFLRTSAPVASSPATLKLLVVCRVSGKWHKCPYGILIQSQMLRLGAEFPKEKAAGDAMTPTEAVTHIHWLEAVETWP